MTLCGRGRVQDASRHILGWLVDAAELRIGLACDGCVLVERPVTDQVAQVAQIFGRVNTLSGYVRPESVSAEFSTTASEP